jgi:hypothetical protein
MSKEKPDMIWSASIDSEVKRQNDLARRAERRVEGSATPDSAFCKELKALADLHRRAAGIFRTAQNPNW